MDMTPNLLAPEVRANPYPLYTWMRRERPVCQIEPGGLWAISRYEDVVAMLRNHQAFSSAGFRGLLLPPWMKSNPVAYSLITTDPPEHARLRGLVSRAFEPRAIARLSTRVHAIAVGLLDRLGSHREVDFMEEFAVPLPARIIAEILGLDPSLYVHFKRWGDALAAISPATPPEMQPMIRAAAGEMEGYLRDVIADRRRRPVDDMVTDLMRPDASGHTLDDEEVLSFLCLLLPAGFETTTNLLANAARILAERPQDLAALRSTPELIPGFVDEVLRYDAPVHGIMRITTTDVTIAGTTIPAGNLVLGLPGSANRDERRFADPDRFDMRRGAGKDLAFGHGIHYCLGAALGRLEARIAIETLTARYARIEQLPGELTWSTAFVVRGPVALPLRLDTTVRVSASRLAVTATGGRTRTTTIPPVACGRPRTTTIPPA